MTQTATSTIQTYFQKSIVAKGLVPEGIDPRHLEAYIRLQYSTLGHLSWADIKREVKIALGCISHDPTQAESLAVSFGL